MMTGFVATDVAESYIGPVVARNEGGPGFLGVILAGAVVALAGLGAVGLRSPRLVPRHRGGGGVADRLRAAGRELGRRPTAPASATTTSRGSRAPGTCAWAPLWSPPSPWPCADRGRAGAGLGRLGRRRRSSASWRGRSHLLRRVRATTAIAVRQLHGVRGHRLPPRRRRGRPRRDRRRRPMACRRPDGRRSSAPPTCRC